jgi:hypothetical protein
MNEEAVAMIKLSSNEISLLINSLGMLESTIVPCVDNGKWKVPYEVLKEDLQRIQKSIIEKQKKMTILNNLKNKGKVNG